MATVGIDPNTFEVLNGHPTKIPTDEILGGVVQNCPSKAKVAKDCQELANIGKNCQTVAKIVLRDIKVIKVAKCL